MYRTVTDNLRVSGVSLRLISTTRQATMQYSMVSRKFALLYSRIFNASALGKYLVISRHRAGKSMSLFTLSVSRGVILRGLKIPQVYIYHPALHRSEVDKSIDPAQRTRARNQSRVSCILWTTTTSLCVALDLCTWLGDYLYRVYGVLQPYLWTNM